MMNNNTNWMKNKVVDPNSTRQSNYDSMFDPSPILNESSAKSPTSMNNDNMKPMSMMNDMPMKQSPMNDMSKPMMNDMSMKQSAMNGMSMKTNDMPMRASMSDDMAMRSTSIMDDTTTRNYSDTRDRSMTTTAGTGMTSGFRQGPPPVTNPEYMAGYLMKNIGRNIRAEFIIGTSYLDKSGKLIEVGVNYFVLEDVNSTTHIMCDLYSVKFVTVLM